MIQPRRDAQRVHLVNKTPAAGANRRADLVALFEYDYRHAAAGDPLRRRKSRRPAARNNNLVSQPTSIPNLKGAGGRMLIEMDSAFARRLVRGLAGYLVAVAALAGVVAIARIFPHVPRPVTAYSGLLVLLASAWWGGYGPGIAVTLAAAFGIPYFVTNTFSLARINYTQLGLLLLVSILVSAVAASRRKVEAALRRANETLDERVRRRTAELEHANFARQEREAQLLHQAEELSLSNAHLEQFAYVASHDLQEPLRMIAVYTELIQRRTAGFDP
jgi:signal transduction histidine kinase